MWHLPKNISCFIGPGSCATGYITMWWEGALGGGEGNNSGELGTCLHDDGPSIRGGSGIKLKSFSLSSTSCLGSSTDPWPVRCGEGNSCLKRYKSHLRRKIILNKLHKLLTLFHNFIQCDNSAKQWCSITGLDERLSGYFRFSQNFW